MRTSTIQLRQRGVLTLPRSLREKYGLSEGDPLTIVDLEGLLLLSPQVSALPKLTAEFERLRREGGVSVKDLMEGESPAEPASTSSGSRRQQPRGTRRASR